MKRITHDLKQGSPEWHEFRATHNGASDAPVMMGKSPYRTRAEFIKELATGEKKEHDWHTKRRLSNGHSTEERARSGIAEDIIGEELYPCVMSYGDESASLDGITIDGKVIVEIKTLNNRIRGCERAIDLPIDYRIQMQQQLYVSGAERCLFVAESDTESVALWYAGEDGLMCSILSHWAELARDVAAYKSEGKSEETDVSEIASFPAVEVSLTGSIQCQDNLDKVKCAIESFMANDLIRSPVDDNDFANLDNQVKALKRVEDGLAKAESAMLAQVDSVAKIKASMDLLKSFVRDSRLSAEKIVKSEKARRRDEALRSAEDRLREFAGDAVLLMSASFFDLSDAIKGLKTMASIKDKLDAAVASKRIGIQLAIDRKKIIMEWVESTYPGKAFLLPDIDALLRDGRDVESVMKSRVKECLEREAAEAAKKAEAPKPAAIPGENKSAASLVVNERDDFKRTSLAMPTIIPMALMGDVMASFPGVSVDDIKGIYSLIAKYFNR